MLEEALEHLVKGIVEHPDDVDVRDRARCGAGGSSRSASTPTTWARSSAAAVVRPRPCAPCSARSAPGHGRPRRLRRRRRGALTPMLRRRRPDRPRPRHPGEVTVDVRTDEPERPVRRRARSCSPTPRPRGPLTVATGRVHSGRLLLHVRRGRRPHGRRGAARHRCCSVDVDPASCPTDDDEWYDHQLVGLRGGTARRARRSASVREVVHLPGQDLLAVRPRRTARGPGPVRADDRPRGRRRRPARRGRPAARAARIRRGRLTPRAHRRRHDLPRLPRAAATVAARQGPWTPGCSTCACTTCAAYAPTGTARVDDTPYGGGAGMVMKPGAVGRGARRSCSGPAAGGAPPRLVVPTPVGRAVHPGSWPTSSRPNRWLVFACGRYEGIDRRVVEDAAEPGAASTRCRSATTCSAGGEVAALVVVEAVARLLPGVLGNAESLAEESPRRRPARVPGLHQAGAAGAGTTCPTCCSSGDHGRIAGWRRDAGPAAYRRACARTCWRPSTRPRSAPADRERAGARSAGRPAPTGGFRPPGDAVAH